VHINQIKSAYLSNEKQTLCAQIKTMILAKNSDKTTLGE